RFEAESFQSRMSAATLGSNQRWVVSHDENTLVLQDVIAVQEASYYSLPYGFVPQPIIQKRRALNSLIVPFALIETPESINILGWDCGRITSRYVKLSVSESDQFDPSLEDAQWILRRIAALGRADFEAIVRQADLPESVSRLLVEKLISRRNALLS